MGSGFFFAFFEAKAYLYGVLIEKSSMMKIAIYFWYGAHLMSLATMTAASEAVVTNLRFSYLATPALLPKADMHITIFRQQVI